MTKVTLDRAVVEQALHVATVAGYPVALIAALRAALAEPVQEPVAWMFVDDTGMRFVSVDRPHKHCQPLYTAPPQRPAEATTIAEWWADKQRKPLTEEEIQAAWDSVDMRHPRGNETRIAFARAIERAHGIGVDK